jgi:hypothetical protein
MNTTTNTTYTTNGALPSSLTNNEPRFTQCVRKSIPKLHFEYVKAAIKHINTINGMIKTLRKYSNVNTHNVADTLKVELDNLVNTNSAYYDAHCILKSINLTEI